MSGASDQPCPDFSARFPKQVRLIRSSEFARVRKEGQPVHGRLMTLGVLKGNADEESRIGLITSKRVGGAVTRNLVRRRLREIVRKARPKLIRGLWLVVVAKSSAGKVSFEKLSEEWVQLARRGRLFEEARL